MPKPIALLDVDQTLLFNDPITQLPIHNNTLLNTLKQKGITDIFLFTDMTFRKLSVQERIDLIKYLEDMSFKVHGVITPCDLAWNQVSGEDMVTFEEALRKNKFGGRFGGEEFNQLLVTLTNILPFINSAQTYCPENTQLGGAFKDAQNALARMKPEDDETTPIPEQILQRSNLAKIFGDWQAQQKGYCHTKALMLELFVHYMPEWVSHIVIADDHPKVIESIGQYKEQEKPTLPITTIHVTSLNHDANFYNNALSPQATAYITKIDNYIRKLNSEFRLFKSDPTLKIEALEFLKTRLLDSPLDADIQTIINDWRTSTEFFKENINPTLKKAVSVQTILAQHRNIFFADSRPGVKTDTETFVDSLLQGSSIH